MFAKLWGVDNSVAWAWASERMTLKWDMDSTDFVCTKDTGELVGDER